jgi:hypothetical protein
MTVVGSSSKMTNLTQPGWSPVLCTANGSSGKATQPRSWAPATAGGFAAVPIRRAHSNPPTKRSARGIRNRQWLGMRSIAPLIGRLG